MNSEQKSQIAKQLRGTLKGGIVIGKSLLNRCCGERMVKVDPNKGIKETQVYCLRCHHGYNLSIIDSLKRDYVSGFS
jgi:hypothetical protein